MYNAVNYRRLVEAAVTLYTHINVTASDKQLICRELLCTRCTFGPLLNNRLMLKESQTHLQMYLDVTAISNCNCHEVVFSHFKKKNK